MSLESKLVWPKRLHWEKYCRPQSIPEVLRILEESEGQAIILAGGTDLLLQIRKREREPRILVDITRIPRLGEIKSEDGVIKIGALTTHRQVAESALIKEKALALCEGASQLGSPQIRNLGTLAGNIVSGQPGADTTIPLLALDAKVKVVSRQGERTVPMTEFFLDTGRTVVDSSREMVEEIFFAALKEGETSICLRLARRKALALPILNVAVFLSAERNEKRFKEVRIALGPVAPIPFRAREAERMLTSVAITDQLIVRASGKAAQEASPRSSLLRGSENYRREMVANLVERAIHRGIERLEVKHA